MKEKNTGKKIAIFYIVLAIIVAMLVTTVLYQVIVNWDKIWQGAEEQGNTEELVLEAKDMLYDNGWGKDIVSEIKADVPIPKGFTYVDGTKDNGLIIQEEGTQNKLLWIPLDEEADLKAADEYYKNIDVPEMDADTYESMLKYGGFYVNIGTKEGYKDLKSVSQEDYDTAVTNANQLYQDKDSMNSHLLYKEEIAQIISYGKKLGVDILKTADNTTKNVDTKLVVEKEPEYKVDKLVNIGTNGTTVNKVSTYIDNYSDSIYLQGSSSTINQWTNIDKYNKNSNYNKSYYKYKTSRGETVYIPQGFRYKESSEGYVQIADQNNQELSYVWIPVKYDLDEVENKIIEKYRSLGILDVVDIENRYNNVIKENLSNQLERSIEQTGGFYMAEAELSFTDINRSTYSTKARDMSRELSSAKKDAQGNVISDYFRKSNIVSDGESVNTLTSKAKNIAENAQKQTSVTSHLTYGIEYDLVALWLIDTGRITANDLMKDSTQIGKYSGTYSAENESTLKASRYPYLNGLWGLGGNLAELSQETWSYNGSSGVILRGGSYATTGDVLQGGVPAQNSKLVDNTDLEARRDAENYFDAESIGIRNCLYVNVSSNGYNPGYGDMTWRQDGLTITGSDGTIVKVGDKITNYNSGKGTSSKQIISYKSETGATKDQTFNLSGYNGGWSVLGAEDGNLLIISDEIIKPSNSGNQNLYLLKGIEGVTNGTDELDRISDFYAQGEYAQSGRSVNVEDINRITEYTPRSIKNVEEYGNRVTYEIVSGRVRYTSTNGVSGTSNESVFKYIDRGYERTLTSSESETFENNALNYSIKNTLNDSSNDGRRAYDLLCGNTERYWLATDTIKTQIGYITYGISSINGGTLSSGPDLYVSKTQNSKGDNELEGSAGIRPVIVLRTDTYLKNAGNNSWKLDDSSENYTGSRPNVDGFITWNGDIANNFERGNGTQNNPYIIEDPSQLAYLAEEVNDGNTFAGKYFEITDSFDMRNIDWTPIGGSGSLSAGSGSANGDGKQFRGIIDGRDNEIANLTISDSRDYRRNVGLFGYLGEGGKISNLHVTSGDITGEENVGAIVGKMLGGTVENCSNEADVNARQISGRSSTGTTCGGIVGLLGKGSIKECTNKGRIIADDHHAGGITGQVSGNTSITNCTNSGDVEGSSTVGGIAGSQLGGTIRSCTNEGDIEAEVQCAGGIVGVKTSGITEQCKNYGTVDAPKYKGQLIGKES